MAINANAAGAQTLSDGNPAGSIISEPEHNFTSSTPVIHSGRVQESKGANIASAAQITLGVDGNYFELTGSTTINQIDTTDWQEGSVITLLVPFGLTVSDSSGQSGVFAGINLISALTPVTGSRGATITLRLDTTNADVWIEIGRGVLQSQV